MEYRLGQAEDLIHIETFVWQAIFPAFDHPDLNEEQRAANDRVVEDAREVAMRAIMREDRVLYVAIDDERQQLAGMVIGEQRPAAYPSLDYLIVARRYWGEEVAAQLLAAVSFWLGNRRPIQLAVRYYNSRAIAFFEKHGFQDTGESAGDEIIPRILMLRPADYESDQAVEEDDRAEHRTHDACEVHITRDQQHKARHEQHRTEQDTTQLVQRFQHGDIVSGVQPSVLTLQVLSPTRR